MALRQGVQNMRHASNEFSGAGTRLAEVASGQAAALEETAASLEELTATNRQNSTSAHTVSKRMQDTDALVQRATGSMEQLVRVGAADCQYQRAHQADRDDHRRDRFPDESPGAQRLRGGCARRGSGRRLSRSWPRRCGSWQWAPPSNPASIARLIEGAHSLTTGSVQLSQKVEALFQEVKMQAAHRDRPNG